MPLSIAHILLSISHTHTHTHTHIKQLWQKPKLTEHDKDSEIVQNMNP